MWSRRQSGAKAGNRTAVGCSKMRKQGLLPMLMVLVPAAASATGASVGTKTCCAVCDNCITQLMG